MGETKVNLKHLLEDIRDSYPCAYEEAIITELVANSLDSGASFISFIINIHERTFIIIDDGNGMNVRNFEEYHDIASSNKVKGKGIGFAGLGVKLSLLFAKEIITETKTSNSYLASKWKLENDRSAPWFEISPRGLINTKSGTAITIYLPYSISSNLLNESFIKSVIQTHFYPILDIEFMNNILKYVYKRGVTFFINQQQIVLPEVNNYDKNKMFHIFLGKKKEPVGIGFVRKYKDELSEELRGLAISTYGKVIKRGWDWLAITPRNPKCLTGIVEIPRLSEILTTNKADFLKDQNSLNKYYSFRKAIQKEIEPILREFGEINPIYDKEEKNYKPLEREIERVLSYMLYDFPELDTLLGRIRKGEKTIGIISDPDSSPIGTLIEGVDIMTGNKGGSGTGNGMLTTEGDIPEDRIAGSEEKTESGHEHEGRKKRPGIMISHEYNPERKELGWLIENTIWINEGHPSYIKAERNGLEKYHEIVTISLVLSSFVEEGKSPLEFVNKFLSYWGSNL